MRLAAEMRALSDVRNAVKKLRDRSNAVQLRFFFNTRTYSGEI